MEPIDFQILWDFCNVKVYEATKRTYDYFKLTYSNNAAIIAATRFSPIFMYNAERAVCAELNLPYIKSGLEKLFSPALEKLGLPTDVAKYQVELYQETLATDYVFSLKDIDNLLMGLIAVIIVDINTALTEAELSDQIPAESTNEITEFILNCYNDV